MKGMNGTTKLSLRTPKSKPAPVNITRDEVGSGEHGGKSFYGPGEQ